MAYVNLLQVIYPIGAIYQSTNATSPASIIGGTWSAIQNRFLVGAGGSYKVNATGGETRHTLTVNEMPAHNHAWQGVNDGASSPSSPGTYPFRIYQDHSINWDGTQASMKNAGGGITQQYAALLWSLHLEKNRLNFPPSLGEGVDINGLH